MRNDMPIGFFDSGVGGLSVYSRFKKLLPNENTIYFGDLKNMPYGTKTGQKLLAFAKRILDFFESKKVKAVVIACNTSSALVYEEIKNNYDFKIYPIIQSCAKVIAQENAKSIGVFATPVTIGSGAYKRELVKHNPELTVIEHACEKWTNFVENGLIDSEECFNDIKFHIEKMLASNPDKIILGCTHYPYLLRVLKKFAPERIFIDPAQIFVDYIKKDLETNNLLNNTQNIGSESFYVSASPEAFVNNAKLFYDVKSLPVIF